MTEYRIVTDLDLLQATLLNRSHLSDGGCWVWTGSKDTGGYGMISRGNKCRKAHRVSFEAFKGEIPAGKILCHSCDTPSCINPDHLRIGTAQDNATDREARGRRDVRGERVGTAKLTEANVAKIKASCDRLDALAAEFGVHKSNISAIRTGRSWKHVAVPVDAA